MAAASEQTCLDAFDAGGEPAPEPHLTVERPRSHNLPATKEREYYCEECACRVTRASDGAGEYGHEPACSHKYRRGGGA